MKRLDKADPYKAWTDEECGKFEASNPPRAPLTAYMLGRYTGQQKSRWREWKNLGLGAAKSLKYWWV